MKQNLLTHIMRLTILFLLFFGWGTGSAVAGTGLECGGTTPTKPTALASDLADPAVGPALLDFLSGNTAGITAAARVNRLRGWETLISHPLIRKDVATLTSVSKILDNTGIENIISRADLQITVQKLAEKGVRCRTCSSGNPDYRYMDEILDDLEHGATKFGNEYTSVITGFKQGGNFTEGAMFVADAVRRYGDDFPAGTLFEFTEVTAGGVRRVDVRVGSTFYEFKSVASVPPSGFATQFIRDMDLADVSDLSQLKWWFDGNKVSSLPKQQFLDQLNAASIDPDIIDKLLYNLPVTQRTKANLLQKISTDFDDIFQIR